MARRAFGAGAWRGRGLLVSVGFCALGGAARGQEMGPPAPVEFTFVGPPASREAFLTDAQLRERAERRAAEDAKREAAEKLKRRQERPDDGAIGERLAEVAQIAAGDLVLVRGGARDAGLLEAVAAQVRRRGGAPLVVLAGDRLERQQFDRSPDSVDAKPNELELKLAAEVTVVIDVQADESPTELAPIPGVRLAARARGVALADELMRRRGVRRVELGNGLYPSAHLANDYSMSEEELSRMFWLAATADAAGMRETGVMVRGSLVGEGRGVITNPNGTDLKFRFAARVRGEGADEMAMTAAGAEKDTGGQAASGTGAGGAKPVAGAINDGAAAGVVAAKLPAGELVAIVAAGSAEGKIVADRLVFRGREVTGLTLTVRGGRVTGLSARSGSEVIRKVYDASGPGKDQVGAVVIGLNPDLRAPSGVKLSSTMPRGMISVVIGGNGWAGGDNDEAFSLPVCLPGSTLRVDGRPVVEDGVLTPTVPLPPEDEGTPAEPAARK